MFARPGLPPFDYVPAASAEEVVSLLREHSRTARLLMGGTDLFPAMRDGKLRPQVVVDVKRLPGMTAIAYDDENGLTIGAAVTMNELARHPLVRSHYPLLAEAANTVASYQVRNRATLGGNLCNASPAADTAPAVLLLEGRLVLIGPQGERQVPAGEFFRGPGQTAIRPGEFLAALRFPPPPAPSAGRYLKLGRNKAGDLALAGVAVYAFPDGVESGYRFRIGLASVGPTPLRAREAEALLAAQPPGEEAFARAAQAAGQAARPISDVRASADYRRAMVQALTLRALREMWEQLEEA